MRDLGIFGIFIALMVIAVGLTVVANVRRRKQIAALCVAKGWKLTTPKDKPNECIISGVCEGIEWEISYKDRSNDSESSYETRLEFRTGLPRQYDFYSIPAMVANMLESPLVGMLQKHVQKTLEPKTVAETHGLPPGSDVVRGVGTAEFDKEYKVWGLPGPVRELLCADICRAAMEIPRLGKPSFRHSNGVMTLDCGAVSIPLESLEMLARLAEKMIRRLPAPRVLAG